MKRLFITVLFTAAACAAPLPEHKGGTIKLECDPSSQVESFTVVFYRSMPSDAAWSVAGTAMASSPSVVVTDSKYGEMFYATFKDISGNESDPSNIATNTVTLSGPGKLKISK
jgi:hypothetical protein